MWATNCCVNRPALCCSISYIILFAICVIAFALNYFELNEPGYRDYLIWDNQRIIDWDMLEAAKIDLLKSDDDKAKPERSEKMSRLKVVYLYKSKTGDSLIEKKNLEEIQKQEEYILDMPEWK